MGFQGLLVRQNLIEGLVEPAGVDLHGRCVRAEKKRTRSAFRQIEIESVHVIADGMVLGNIQCLEIVVRRLDLRAFDDGKADRKENIFDFLENLADQMVGADGTNDARERKVGPFANGSQFCSRFLGGNTEGF